MKTTVIARICAFSLLGLLALSCKSTSKRQNNADSEHIEKPTKNSTIDMSEFVNHHNQFALALFQIVGKEEEGNTFISPYSLYTAVSMAYVGAGGSTAKEMQEVLGINQTGLLSNFSQLNQTLTSSSEGSQLLAANALWADQAFQLSNSYKEQCQKAFDAQVATVNFMNEPQESCNTINDWVNTNTKGKIEKLLAPNAISQDTRLILTNAIYFKGDWKKAFDEKNTQPHDFYLSQGESIQSKFMSQSDSFPYFQDEKGAYLKLPYASKYNMIVALPDANTTLQDFMSKLDMPTYKKWQKSFQMEKLDVHLPKFSITGDVGMKPYLSNLGMQKAFSQGEADFSGIEEKANRLYIEEVVHKSLIEVNEAGAEAAAATGVIIGTRAIRKSPQFRANRPFVFFITEEATGAILFVGTLVKPEEA